MAESRSGWSLGREDTADLGIRPPRTPGSLGINDAADPSTWSWVGSTPGPVGINDHATPNLGVDTQLGLPLQKVLVADAGGKGGTVAGGAAPVKDKTEEKLDPDVELLAAVSYGEAGTGDVFEEMAAIANVIVHQRDARGITLSSILGPKSTYAFAASDGNQRVAAFRKASEAAREKDPGMAAAIKAARNALDPKGTDYSNGAYFWDGADLKSNYAKHPKVKQRIKFTKPEHNIYKVKESTVDVTTHWMVKDKEGKIVEGKERGHYTYTYESTAAYGGTIFWKYNPDFLKATGNKEYK
jgi:hypothetical protein